MAEQEKSQEISSFDQIEN